MAEKRTIELEIKDNSKSLKAQLREAQAEVAALADKYGATSDQAVNAAKRAAELKDRIGDAKALTDAFNPDAKFKALSASLTGVAGGFSAVTGAMGLVGVEGESVQQAMLKVQSAMALSQGLQSLGEARDSFKQLGAVATNTFKSLSSESSLVGKATAALGPIWKAVGVSGKGALQGIRAGIAATGIGLLVVALGTIVTYWDDIKGAVSGVSREQEALNRKTQAQLEASEHRLAVLNKQDNILKLQGKSEKEILQYKIAELNTSIKNAKVNIENAITTRDSQVAAAKRNRDILAGILKFIAAPITAIFTTIDTIIWALNKVGILKGQLNLQDKVFQSIAEYMFDPEEVKTQGDKTIEEAKIKLVELENEQAGYKLRIKDIEKEAENDRKKINEDNAKKQADFEAKVEEDKRKRLEDYNKNLTAYYDAMEKQRQEQLASERDKEIADMEAKYEELYRIADAAGQDTSQLQKDQANEYAAINKKYNEIELKAQEEKNKKLQEMMKQMEDEATKQFIIAEEIKISAMQEGFDKQAAIRKLAYDKEQIELQNKLDANQITEEQFQLASRVNYKAYLDGINEDSRAAYEKDVNDQKAAYEQKSALQTQYIDIATQAANLIKDLFGKSKAAQKTAVIVESAAGIAKMIISNKLANLGALATPQAIATSGAAAAPVIAANNVSLGLGIAANIAATAKALKEIGGGGSAPSAPSTSGGGATSGGAGGGGVMAPNFNVVGNNGLNQLAQLQQQPIKAYVVGSEVTTQQALDRNRIQNGTL